MEGWKVEGLKIASGWKSEKIKKKIFIFSSFLFGWEWKSKEMKKISLNKFTHIPLLKNNIQLKYNKKWQITTQKRVITQIYYKNENNVPKKSRLAKKKTIMPKP